MSPKVTFVVPCYKLAHLLPECINSILVQTFQDFEILIMDDCSPDRTPEVAQSFADPRIKHIRNEPNLGHLRNYNKGIELARGKYVWLISADDRLRRQYVLERYVELMEKYPNVGYAFCPAMSLVDGQETGVADYSAHGNQDVILDGRGFLAQLVYGNCVAAASGLVRKECYDQLSMFPLDLPYAGDWYMWCIFSLYHDVAYFAEPMVNYRLHQMSMTNALNRKQYFLDDLELRWRLKRLLEKTGSEKLVRECLESIAKFYARCLLSARFEGSDYPLSFEEFEESLQHHATSQSEARIVHARVCTVVGDGCYSHREPAQALEYYAMALHEHSWAPRVWAKSAFLYAGKAARLVRGHAPVLDRLLSGM